MKQEQQPEAAPERFAESRVLVSEEYAAAVAAGADRWVPACGGTEEPFAHHGTSYLYVFNPATGEHGYLNLGTDMVDARAPWDS